MGAQGFPGVHSRHQPRSRESPADYARMDLKELESVFGSASILLVEVEALDDAVDRRALRIAGCLEDYIAAAKALHILVVFYFLEKLQTADFLFSAEDDELPAADDDEVDDDCEGEDETDGPKDHSEQDLCAVKVELQRFKSHLGDVGRIWLYAPTQPNGLTYLIESKWYTQFLDIRDSALESIHQRFSDEQAGRFAAENQRRIGLAAKLDDLANDKKFARLPTQKAMLAYAKLNVPGLDDMDNDALKSAISELWAKMIAKGV
jgi:hypothetical protein